MNFKLALTGAALAAIMVTGAACSSDKGAATPAPTTAATAAPATPAAESQDIVNLKGYTAARIAQEKVEHTFAEAQAKDKKTFILNPGVADSKDKAVKFLTAYVDAALADKIAAHYLTDKQADGAIVTNNESFFPTSILATTKADITFDAANTADLVKFTTKDGVTVTAKNVNGTFVLADIAKK